MKCAVPVNPSAMVLRDCGKPAVAAGGWFPGGTLILRCANHRAPFWYPLLPDEPSEDALAAFRGEIRYDIKAEGDVLDDRAALQVAYDAERGLA